MTEPSGNPFWDYTLALYGRPGVAPALIGLQDRLGLDVNMILFCCWAGAGGRVLSLEDLSGVEAAGEPWQAEIVRPLRALRRRLKGGFGNLPAGQVEAYRKRINALEIDGERVAQDAMLAMLRSTPTVSTTPVAADIAANLRAYLGRRGANPAHPDQTDLTTILRACCPNQRPDSISFDGA